MEDENGLLDPDQPTEAATRAWREPRIAEFTEHERMMIRLKLGMTEEDRPMTDINLSEIEARANAQAAAYERMLELDGGVGLLSVRHPEMGNAMHEWMNATKNEHADTVLALVQRIRELEAERSPVPPETTIDEWRSLIHAERATHAEKGYTPEHDREHGPDHLIDWAIDYARRGKTVEAAAMMLALRDLRAAVPPMTEEGIPWASTQGSGVYIAGPLGEAMRGPQPTSGSTRAAVPPETDEAIVDRVARAIFDVRDDEFDMDEWEDLGSVDRERYLCDARAALAAVPPVTEETEWEYGVQIVEGVEPWEFPRIRRTKGTPPGPWVPVSEGGESNG